MNPNAPSANRAIPEHLRPLKWDELVRRGDFVQDENQEFQLWEGPGGFRADSFMKQIYRALEGPPAATKKPS